MDRFILERVFQPIADWTSNTWDKSCYWLAGQCALAFGTFALVDVLIHDLPHYGIGVAVFNTIVFVAWSAGAFLRAAMEEKRSAADKGLNLSLYVSNLFSRWLWIALLVFNLYQLYDDLSVDRALRIGVDVGAIAYYFFMSCLPNPPRRKVTQSKLVWAGAGS